MKINTDIKQYKNKLQTHMSIQRTGTKIKAGIIGLGHWGGQYIKLLQNNPMYHLTVIYDIDSEKALAYAKKFTVNAASSIDHFLNHYDIEAVFILTPSHLHSLHFHTIAQIGIHAYVEKPIDIKVECAKQMCSAALEFNTKLYVAHSMKMDNTFQKAKSLISEGRIGQVQYFISNRSVPKKAESDWRDGNIVLSSVALLQLGIHLIDSSRFLFGEISDTQVSSKQNTSIRKSDTIIILGRYSSGITGTISCSYNTQNDFLFYIYGTEGILKITNSALYLCANQKERLIVRSLREKRLLNRELCEFAIWIRNGQVPLNTAENAISTLSAYETICGNI